MDTAVLIAVVILIAILAIFLTYYLVRLGAERRLEEERNKLEAEREGIRREAIAQSRAVLGGKFVEQLVPYLPEFRYDPTEARFIGSPIDLIVFPGLASGDPREIVIVEVKTGKAGQLTPQEKKIRQLIEDGMVRWELIHPAPPEG